MSDTPRTDAAEANAIASGIPISMVCRQIERELNEARGCLREILGGFGVCGCHVPALYATGIRSQIEIDRWRKAAGLGDKR